MGRVQPPPNAPSPVTGAGGIIDSQTVLVSTKEAWTDDWENQPNLQPIRSIEALAPTINSATFRYSFGEHKTARSPDFATLEALGLQDHYVRIQILTDTAPRIPVSTWIGQLVHDGRSAAGVEPDTPPNDPAGEQQYTAFGLEHLLKKAPIDRTWVVQDDVAFSIPQAVAFNRRVVRGGPLEGNADAPSTPIDDAFGFPVSVVGRTGLVWAHSDIVDYLLHFFVNERGAPKFLLSQSRELLAQETIENFFGWTVWDALNKLVDRRRGLTWFVRVADTDQDPLPVEIVIQSTLDDEINLSDDDGTPVIIPPNPNQITIDFDPNIRIKQFGVTKSSANRYSKVEVRGSPIRSMMTVSFIDGTLEKGWTDDEETAYKDAASGTVGYAGLSTAEKMVINDRFRREDSSVSHVFRRFRLSPTFNWMVGDGLGNFPSILQRWSAAPQPNRLFGVVDSHIIGHTGGNVFNPGKTFMRTLLLDKRKDYSASPPIDANPADDLPDLLEPFVIVHDFLNGLLDFRIAHHMGAISGNNLPTTGLRMLPNELGFELVLSGSTPNHAWARRHWIPHGPSAVEPSQFVPTEGNSNDYEQMIVTVAVIQDERPSMLIDTGLVVDNDPHLIIDIPDLQWWSAVAPTIWGFSETGDRILRIHGDNLDIRDDTSRLRRIGAFAKAWYSRERRAIDVTWGPPMDAVGLGAMLLSVSTAQAQTQTNSVVSLIERDYLEQTARMVTDFVELDLAAVFRGPGVGGGDGGGGGVTPSLGPTRTVVKSQAERIDRLEEQLKDIDVHPAAENVGMTDAFVGKIVSWHEDLCHVARMEFGDPNLWGDRAFTGESAPAGAEVIQCAWKGVGTTIEDGQPVLCFKPANSSRYVAMPWYNDVGNWVDAGGENGEFQACEPDADEVVDPGPSCTGPVGSEDYPQAAGCET